MPVQSAGILLYREVAEKAEVLLVHPGGPFYANRDEGVWSIPKGILEDGEEGLKTAKREFKEELGLEVPATEFISLEPIRQKGNKIVHAWAAKGDLDPKATHSNTFRLEYPNKSGNWIEAPEVDQAEWFDLKEASVKILPAQLPLLNELASILSNNR